MTLTTNLNSYWKLDGNSNDSVGAFNGTDTAITYSSGNGKINQGAGFNGSSSYISLGSVFQITGDMTINAWFKSSAANSAFDAGTFIAGDGRSGTPTQNLLIRPNQPGGVGTDPVASASCTSGGTNYNAIDTGGQKLNDGNWHMITGVFSGTNLIVYVDGTSKATVTSAAKANGASGGIGANNNNGSTIQFTNGAIDEVGVWSRALSGSEITTLYNGGAGLQYPFTASSNAFLGFF